MQNTPLHFNSFRPNYLEDVQCSANTGYPSKPIRMMIRNIIIVLLSVIACQARAQKESNIWYFGDKAGLDFSSGSPVAISNTTMNAWEGSASISHRRTGQILFYTDGATVWNKNHLVMTNGWGLNGHSSSTQSAVIMPMPGDTMKYYIFTADQGGYSGPNKGIFYSIVNMGLAAGKGAVTVKNVSLLIPATEKNTAVRHCNGIDVWVLSHGWNNNNFYAWHVTPAGVSAPVVSSEGAIHTGASSNTIGYLKSSPDGKHLALATYKMNTVELFDFDNRTGVVSKTISLLSVANEYGLSFSPDNTRLYVANTDLPTGCSIYQYNVAAGNAGAIIASRTLITTTNESFGALQIGPDGKLYVVKKVQSVLAVINKPNELGLACMYVDSAITFLSGTTSNYGLPNFVESVFSVRASFTSDTVCFGDSTHFAGHNTVGSWFWRFGDPASGAADTSSAQNPSHRFTSPGTYYISLIVKDICAIDSIAATVTIAPPPRAFAGDDVTICFGDSVTLHASGGNSYSWQPTTGLSDPGIANPVAKPTQTTTYTVTVANSAVCTGKDSVVVNVLPQLTHSFTTNPVNLGVTQAGTSKQGKATFTNPNSSGVHISNIYFTPSGFGTLTTPFPQTLPAGKSLDVNFTCAAPDTFIYNGTLCIEIDSACRDEHCVLVTIEGVSTCITPQIASATTGKKPGDEVIVPILIDPSTKFSNAKQVIVTVKYDPALLGFISATSSYDAAPQINTTANEIQLSVTPTAVLSTPTARIAELHMQALLAPYAQGTMDVTVSRITLTSGEEISGTGCPQMFSLDSSCIRPSALKSRPAATIEGLYPNPSYTKTTLVIIVKNNPRVRLEVYDTFGRQVEVLRDGEMSDGNHEIMINTESYATGIYFCRMIHNGQITTRAFNVQR